MSKKTKEVLKSFETYLEMISRAHDRYSVFDDFLTIVVCALSMGLKEDEYHKTIKKYTREELDLFVKAFAAILQYVAINELSDPFGGYYEEFLSNGKNGQFFTPESVCNLMAQIMYTPKAEEDTGEEKDKRVNDPACGSGRLLLSSAKMNRERYFIGCDISLTCCKMTLINLCLNGLRGEVLHMNTISYNIWCRWFVMIDEKTNKPFIYEVTQEDRSPSVAAAPEREIQEVEFIEEISPVQAVLPKCRGFVRFGMKA